MVSPAEAAAGLIREYLGWFGGDYFTVAKTDCLALQIALEGRYATFDTILDHIAPLFDKKRTKADDPANWPVMTQGMFGAMFGKKN